MVFNYISMKSYFSPEPPIRKALRKVASGIALFVLAILMGIISILYILSEIGNIEKECFLSNYLKKNSSPTKT
jgi:hypothetical protein